MYLQIGHGVMDGYSEGIVLTSCLEIRRDKIAFAAVSGVLAMMLRTQIHHLVLSWLKGEGESRSRRCR